MTAAAPTTAPKSSSSETPPSTPPPDGAPKTVLKKKRAAANAEEAAPPATAATAPAIEAADEQQGEAEENEGAEEEAVVVSPQEEEDEEEEASGKVVETAHEAAVRRRKELKEERKRAEAELKAKKAAEAVEARARKEAAAAAAKVKQAEAEAAARLARQRERERKERENDALLEAASRERESAMAKVKDTNDKESSNKKAAAEARARERKQRSVDASVTAAAKAILKNEKNAAALAEAVPKAASILSKLAKGPMTDQEANRRLAEACADTLAMADICAKEANKQHQQQQQQQQQAAKQLQRQQLQQQQQQLAAANAEAAAAKSRKEEAERQKQLGNSIFTEAGELTSTAARTKAIERAIQHYDKAIELNPSEATYYGNRSNALFLLGRPKELRRAHEDAKRANELQPAAFRFAVRMMRPLAALGRYCEALGAFETGKLFAELVGDLPEMRNSMLSQDAKVQIEVWRKQYVAEMAAVDAAQPLADECYAKATDGIIDADTMDAEAVGAVLRSMNRHSAFLAAMRLANDALFHKASGGASSGGGAIAEAALTPITQMYHTACDEALNHTVPGAFIRMRYAEGTAAPAASDAAVLAILRGRPFEGELFEIISRMSQRLGPCTYKSVDADAHSGFLLNRAGAAGFMQAAREYAAARAADPYSEPYTVALHSAETHLAHAVTNRVAGTPLEVARLRIAATIAASAVAASPLRVVPHMFLVKYLLLLHLYDLAAEACVIALQYCDVGITRSQAVLLESARLASNPLPPVAGDASADGSAAAPLLPRIACYTDLNPTRTRIRAEYNHPRHPLANVGGYALRDEFGEVIGHGMGLPITDLGHEERTYFRAMLRVACEMRNADASDFVVTSRGL